MSFFEIFLGAFGIIMAMMTLLWFISILIRNVSIVDLFWGFGFVLAAATYFILTPEFSSRGLLVLSLVTIWGLRLTIYLSWRNIGKGEDFRYQNFRKKYGAERYWWLSFFQTFLLQGMLMWLVSAPLLGAQFFGSDRPLFWLDYLGIFVWVIGFFFETMGDLQLAKFKSLPTNKGKVLDKGLWRYTRHPNYFGDAAVWWGFGIFSMAAGCYLPFLGSLLMTALIIKVSGVSLLEKTLKSDKPEYIEYVRKTSAFIPWFPKK
jgi:steroid 5-alpha reductase family enzyme